MNAPGILTLLRTPADCGLSLRFRTLTPLYTGGIGQLGDQVHPSNLLGGIRHMSCLVARTLGDGTFEPAVWGNAGQGGANAAGKRVTLRWDTTRLERVTLPEVIRVPKAGGETSRWWFNQAYSGELDLAITRRGISDSHWDILRLALAIQVRHGSFGAKDQFGLGVLEMVDQAAACAPLDVAATWPAAIKPEPGRLNLLRYVFGRVGFRTLPGQRPNLNRSAQLTLGLATRATLRNALRAKADDPEAEKQRMTVLRHRMLGKLNQFGSAVNVSAAYGSPEKPELRIVIALKPEDKDERAEVFRRFREALKGGLDSLIEGTGYRTDGQAWEFGGAQGTDKKAAWLNKLAGV